MPVASWLTERGYRVGINLMQIADRTPEEVAELTRITRGWPIEVLYFADSMGSMTPDDTARIVGLPHKGWNSSLGIHTHHNLGLALANTLRAHALDASAFWRSLQRVYRFAVPMRSLNAAVGACPAVEPSARSTDLSNTHLWYFPAYTNKYQELLYWQPARQGLKAEGVKSVGALGTLNPWWGPRTSCTCTG